ncbi:zinc finger, C3HC4 type [Necator americanus]|uniref:Zinc finger, C3HC4 type n=1 Tax=Necator americanus TaxID=51031 RepID=W2SVZ8_NECAM|nr:zinc finger, C3HC4 type [Necator americanus]ETN72872.1 zinc finger, C3HC4 type [Necator americanus]
MAIRRKQARGRPVKDPSPESPPPRRAKTIANANIAAQFMVDIDEPSAKMLKLDLNDSSSKDGYDSGTMVKAETDPTSSGQISDSCAICLGTRVDPTKLDNCIHSFCFTCTSQWFKYSEKCPLCMVPTKTFMHKLKSGDGEEKVDLVSDVVFRSLIYKDNLEWSSIDRNANRDEAASSNSEASNAGDFYTRPACRLPRSQIPASRDPLQVIDAFGVLREIYAGFPESRFSSIPLKSLFQPSAKKVMPGAKTEIRDENKLLAKLFHERQLRNAQMNHQNPQNTTEDQMDTSGTVDTTAQDSGTIGNGSAAVVPERQLDSEAAPHVSTDLIKVELNAFLYYDRALINRRHTAKVKEAHLTTVPDS